MNTEQHPAPADHPPAEQPPPAPPPPDQAGWGAPPPPPEQRPKWSVRKTIVAVAIAVGIAAAGGVAIYAASGSVDNEGGPGGGPNGRMVVGGPMGDLGHGEFQNGEVTSIDDTSITAESEDGYERTYTITDDTQQSGDIESGDEVMIIATTDGDTATAVTIMEAGAMPNRQGGPNGGNGGPPQLNGGPDDQTDGN